MARLSDDEIQEQIGRLDGWSRDGDAIVKEFDRGDFAGSVALVNDRILPVAEQMNHHPDLAISWSKVTVTITTHSEGGLTSNDFELARKIDAAA
jgi:4a-hydroxytetrahydrobiopterin dehydratase